MNASWTFLPAAFIFGTLIGSFLNVVIWRLPREQSLGGRSRCPHCGYQLKLLNLIPVLSYLGQGRRCAHCHQPISPRYAFIEIVTGILFALAAWYVPAAWLHIAAAVTLLRLWFILAVLVAVFVIDLEHYLILDRIVLPGAIALLIFNVVIDVVNHHSPWLWLSQTFPAIVAALGAAGFFYAIWLFSRGRWMGFGDVKYNLFLGLALGWPGIITGLFLSFILGTIVGLGLIASGKKQLGSKVPFGTFLSLAAALTLFYGAPLITWYLRLIGWY